jgi:hypothetical protein
MYKFAERMVWISKERELSSYDCLDVLIKLERTFSTCRR